MSNPDSKLTLNEKLKELETAVGWFNSDDFSLDKAIENYQAAIKLAREIETDLESLKNEVKVLSQDFSKD